MRLINMYQISEEFVGCTEWLIGTSKREVAECYRDTMVGDEQWEQWVEDFTGERYGEVNLDQVYDAVISKLSLSRIMPLDTDEVDEDGDRIVISQSVRDHILDFLNGMSVPTIPVYFAGSEW